MLDISNDTFTDDEEFTEEEEGSGAIYGKHLKVLIALNKPFAMLKKGSQKLKGNDRFEGFSVELIHELSEMIGFEYTFVVQEDKTYGSQNAFTGEWSGMIRQIIDQVSFNEQEIWKRIIISYILASRPGHRRSHNHLTKRRRY